MQVGQSTEVLIRLTAWVCVMFAMPHAQAVEAAPHKGDWSAPVDACTTDSGSQACVARLLFNGDNAHATDARRQKSSGTKGFHDVCIPPRFLELWNPQARKEAEDICGLEAGSLDAVGRYFACTNTTSPSDQCQRPKLGVALEGGGSKSAPFALGTLAGLEASGYLPKAEVISSASGGTYAAYFLFARLLDRHLLKQAGNTKVATRALWFKDCIPNAYDALFRKASTSSEINHCEEGPSALFPDSPFEKHAPFLHQVRIGQDLLYPAQNVSPRGETWYSADWLKADANIAWLTAQHLVTAPLHWVAHGVFSWSLNFSPSREAYRSGIERAYGHTADTWQTALKQEDVKAPLSLPKEHVGTHKERGWQLEDLREAYLDNRNNCQSSGEPCDFPLWIMSTTSTAGRDLTSWLSIPPQDQQRFSFELTPMGHGSGLLGFLNRPPKDMTLRDAVGTSAAFLDYEQRVFGGNKAARFFANSAIFAVNGDWGTNIDNFNVDDAKRSLYAAAPWPFYGLTWFQGQKAPYVHLTDGGNSDNLGIFSQLRRGVRTIVVSASTEDRKGEFPSLCKLKNELELERLDSKPSVYTLLVPALQSFDQVCNKQLGSDEARVWGKNTVLQLRCERAGLPLHACAADRLPAKSAYTGYNVWFWPSPVLDGCVIRRTSASGPNEDSCAQARQEGREISRLLIIKPAIWLPNVAKQMVVQKDGWQIAACTDDSTPGMPKTIGQQAQIPQTPPGMDIPCQSLAYLHYNWLEQPKDSLLPAFPQDNFALQTINSSYTLFGAYFDLARHYASQIKVVGDGVEVPTRPTDTIEAMGDQPKNAEPNRATDVMADASAP